MRRDAAFGTDARLVAEAAARALAELAAFPRDFDWYTSAMKRYSVMAAAEGLAEKINQFTATPQSPP